MSETVRGESRDRHCLKHEDELIRAEVGSEYMNGGGDGDSASTAEPSIDVATKAKEVNEEFDTEIDIEELNFKHKAFLDTVFDALTGNHDPTRWESR